jgi:hypothetical protein
MDKAKGENKKAHGYFNHELFAFINILLYELYI